MKKQHQALFISHGGGPLPLLGDNGHKEMVACLTRLATRIKKPSAIILVSAHWEEDRPVITSGNNPNLIYDYYGFPKVAYSIKYPCPGEPALAAEIQNSLSNLNIVAELDEQRGYDHGMFVPLKIMYPKADIPCVQLSLINNLNPAEHIQMGQALQSLDYDNLLLIGSGSSFHNMNAFFAPETNAVKSANVSFENWLRETCCDASIDEEERTQRLSQWITAPAARYCHPREEHLLPLHVCYGLTNSACSESIELEVLNKKMSLYLW